MVAIIDYNAGNIRSVLNALNRLGVEATLTNKKELIQSAEKVIFPGVGEAASAMSHLEDQGLTGLIPQLTQPVLGICLGLQLMCNHSEENNTKCMGIFDVKVKRFQSSNEKIPHMGWNTLSFQNHSLFEGIGQEAYFYFVHSFYAEQANETIGQTRYIEQFSAALQKNNFYATQFHPEKSGAIGEQVLKNFLAL